MSGNERSIFLGAIELEDRSGRDAFLAAECDGDNELRSSVEALLAAHDAPHHLLDQPIVSCPPIAPEMATSYRDPVKHVGMTIGNYELMEQIGEGGFGLVFVAQQNHPVRRRVALKIVKPGMGTQEVIARFEAERQAVAMMDHPNIAQIFDAGVTEDQRPYFVMELVRGVPITEFCDNQMLDIHERLNLFNDVCSAVHHAHQKGVIHRDIKPSNVMVTLHDDRSVVKVIDFGVAKAIGQSLTDKTIYTRFVSMIGTPLYMSPEQAEMSGLDVDTRSDIYSLGVLLYELLTGSTPHDRERMNSANYDEMRRIIREEDPPRPSWRISTIGSDPSTIAATRQTSPSGLTTTIRGDLDWIVMKAIEKDRTRRYESATAMAADIVRFQTQQPIDARPPSLTYQLRKFANRNRVAIGTISLVAMSLILGTAISLWQMRSAMNQRDQKEQALREIEQFSDKIMLANSLTASAQANAAAGKEHAAKLDFDLAVSQQPSYYLPWIARAQFLTQQQRWSEAADDYAMAISLESPITTPQWWGTASLFRLTGHDHAYHRLSQRLDAHVREGRPIENWEFVRNCVAGPSQISTESLETLKSLTKLWFGQQREAEFARRPPPPNRSRNSSRAKPPPPQVCNYIFGLVCLRMNEFDQALRSFRHADDDRRWPGVGLIHSPMAICFEALDRHREALESLKLARAAIEELPSLDAEDEVRRAPWFDVVEMKSIYREAQDRVIGSDAVFQP